MIASISIDSKKNDGDNPQLLYKKNGETKISPPIKLEVNKTMPPHCLPHRLSEPLMNDAYGAKSVSLYIFSVYKAH